MATLGPCAGESVHWGPTETPRAFTVRPGLARIVLWVANYNFSPENRRLGRLTLAAVLPYARSVISNSPCTGAFFAPGTALHLLRVRLARLANPRVPQGGLVGSAPGAAVGKLSVNHDGRDGTNP